jgi:Electron transfer DM13
VGAGRGRTRVIVIALLAVALAAGGAVVWFQPQKPFIDQRVDEAPPGVPAAGPATTGDGPRDRFDDEFVSLGRLKANQGNQNYELDAGTSLDGHRTVVIWCRRFTYAFGAADLAVLARARQAG